MFRFQFFLVAALNKLSLAQSIASTSSSSTPTSTPTTHHVDVGRSTHQFVPSNISAKPGDIVEFQFWSNNHSVVKHAFDYPCQPYELWYRDQPGFFSGPFVGVDDDVNPPTWNLTVNDTNPVFFYCTAINSCTEYKMIGVINPNSTFTLEEQKAKININTTIMVYPGQELPAEGSPAASSSASSTTSSTTSSAAASVPTATAPTAATSTPASANSTSHVSISPGAIAGIAVGAAVVIALVGALFWYMGRSRMMKKALEQQQQQQQQQRDSGFQHYPKGSYFSGDSDGRGSVSYAGSPAPDKRTAIPMETVYDIDRHGSPELDSRHVPDIIGYAAEYDQRGRPTHRFSAATSELGGVVPEPLPRDTNPRGPIHELG